MMDLLNKVNCIRNEILENGISTINTVEIQNSNNSFIKIKDEDFNDYNGVEDLSLIYNYIQENIENDTRVVGHYIIDKYTFLNKELDYVINRFEENSKETRQAIISFPREHCFESIQFLYRQNKLITIVNMRSCNFEANFVGDIYLAFRLSKTVVSRAKLDTKQIDIHINIGSLHIFDYDYQMFDVKENIENGEIK